MEVSRNAKKKNKTVYKVNMHGVTYQLYTIDRENVRFSFTFRVLYLK